MAVIIRPASTMLPAFSGTPGGYPGREWTPGRLACGIALIAGIHLALALTLAHLKTAPRLSVGIAPLFVSFIESVHPGPPSVDAPQEKPSVPPVTEIRKPMLRTEPKPAKPRSRTKPDPAAAPVMTAQPAPSADAQASFTSEVEEPPAGGQSPDASGSGSESAFAATPGGASMPTVNISAVRYLIPPVPVYPDISRRRREEGKVTLRVLIDADGDMREIAVAESSGYFHLDDAARTALARAKFQPYLENGRGIPVRVLAPFNFYLER